MCVVYTSFTHCDKTTWHLTYVVDLLTCEKLHFKFGTCNADSTLIISEIFVLPIPVMVDKEVATVLTLRLLAHGV